MSTTKKRQTYLQLDCPLCGGGILHWICDVPPAERAGTPQRVMRFTCEHCHEYADAEHAGTVLELAYEEHSGCASFVWHILDVETLKWAASARHPLSRITEEKG